jgi:N-acetylneuraminate synthase
MAKVSFQNGTQIGVGEPVYIVAELNTSHFGNLDLAKEMILRVKVAGANCVKFQSWTSESLYSPSYFKQNPISRRFLDKFALNNAELLELSNYAQEVGLDFASTPYSNSEVDFLVEQCEVSFIKVASMDLNNRRFLQYISSKNIPIVLSTGMGTIQEIEQAVMSIQELGNQKTVLLHCVSLYPTNDKELNLRNLMGLRKKFPSLVIGFSDHSIGEVACFAAVAMGASLLEKHVTLDSSRIGMDNQMAMEIGEFESLVIGVRRIEAMLGSEDRILSERELSKAKELRRSIHAKHFIAAGRRLREEDLEVLRPGNGISPDKLDEVVGLEARIDIPANKQIAWEDFHLNGRK